MGQIVDDLLSVRAPRASWLLSAGVGAASFFVYFLRSLPLANKLWAEDASVYLTNAYDHPLRGIVKPYNGYLDLVPGVLELPLRLVAPASAPLAIIVITGVVYAVVAALATRVASLYLRSVYLAVALGLATVLVPVLAQEAIAELGALQFVLAYALFWLTLLPAARGADVWVPAALALLVALTSPLAVAAIPLALLVGWRNSAKRPLAAALVLGAVAEGVIHFSGAGGQRGSTGESAAGAGARGVERLFSSLAPNEWTGSAGARAAVSLAVVLLFVVALGALVARSRRRPVVVLALAAFVSGVWFELFAAVSNHGTADRYLVPSSLLLIVALIACVDAAVAVPRRLAFVSCSAAALVTAAGMGADWRPGAWRSSSSPWDAQVAAAAKKCVAGRRERIVPIPAGAFPWAVADVPCSRL